MPQDLPEGPSSVLAQLTNKKWPPTSASAAEDYKLQQMCAFAEHKTHVFPGQDGTLSAGGFRYGAVTFNDEYKSRISGPRNPAQVRCEEQTEEKQRKEKNLVSDPDGQPRTGNRSIERDGSEKSPPEKVNRECKKNRKERFIEWISPLRRRSCRNEEQS